MGELSHTQSNPFQNSFEACQCNYSKLAGNFTWLYWDTHRRPYHSPFRSVTLDYPIGREQIHGAIHG